jgi:replication initiation and membrane attachment protein DnaB
MKFLNPNLHTTIKQLAEKYKITNTDIAKLIIEIEEEVELNIEQASIKAMEKAILR